MAEVAGAIDLHTHTTASDGLLAPRDLVRFAREAGLGTIAITDHDTAAGVRALREAPGEDGAGVEVVAGIEISSAYGGSELHILGYFIDPDHPRILAYEGARRALRRQRLEAMVERLRAAGMDVDMAQVDAQIGGDGAPGRPHLARVLVARGYARDNRDCFDRLFARGGPGYVAYEKAAPAEAAALVAEAGGVAVIAHPGLDGVGEHLDALIGLGLDGIEVWHSAHDGEQQDRFEAYAREHGLLMTGGSDFHGVGQREGGGLGGVCCPPACFAALRQRARAGRTAEQAPRG